MSPGDRDLLPTRVIWYVECLAFKRIDAWGVGFIAGTLALLAHQALSIRTGLLLAAITAHYWLGYWLNDYYDAARDRRDEKKARLNFFVRHPARRGKVLAIAAVIYGLSVWPYGLFGWRGLLVLSVNGLVIWAYSAPPVRLKSRPGLDLVTHAVFVQTWPYWICMWLISANWTRLDGALVVICCLASLSGQLGQQLRDFEVDSKTDTTFATHAGRKATARLLKLTTLALVVVSVTVVASGMLPWRYVPLGILGFPKFMLHLFQDRQSSSRAYPRPLIYATMVLALLYTGALILLASEA